MTLSKEDCSLIKNLHHLKKANRNKADRRIS